MQSHWQFVIKQIWKEREGGCLWTVQKRICRCNINRIANYSLLPLGSKDWKSLSVHPAANGYLNNFREGYRRRKELIGPRLSHTVPKTWWGSALTPHCLDSHKAGTFTFYSFYYISSAVLKPVIFRPFNSDNGTSKQDLPRQTTKAFRGTYFAFSAAISVI